MNPSASIPRPCACTTVRTASRVLARAYDLALQNTSLNVTQLAVLRSMDRHPGAPLMRVAEALSMDRTSVYRAAATMVRNGWIQMQSGQDDRSRSAIITKQGREVLEEAAPHWERVQSALVDRFGRRRWQALVQELEELAHTASPIDHSTEDAET